MPGKDRLIEVVKESVEEARLAGDGIAVAAIYPDGASEASVGASARVAHEAIDKAADAAKILVREGG